ncbi:MAG TPA: RDD family protein [Bauldia sp.]|nr:RDD family protein [Bauldia sp.]
MTTRYRHGYDAVYDAFDREGGARPSVFEAVLSRRVVAFLIDAFLVGLLCIPLALVVFVLGFLTFGLGWLLFAPLYAIVALVYVALTAGGRFSATPGMRFTGIEMRTLDGDAMFPLLAVAHALLFWLSIGLLTPAVLLVGFLTPRRQLLHDIVLGVVVVNVDGDYR